MQKHVNLEAATTGTPGTGTGSGAGGSSTTPGNDLSVLVEMLHSPPSLDVLDPFQAEGGVSAGSGGLNKKNDIPSVPVETPHQKGGLRTVVSKTGVRIGTNESTNLSLPPKNTSSSGSLSGSAKRVGTGAIAGSVLLKTGSASVVEGPSQGFSRSLKGPPSRPQSAFATSSPHYTAGLPPTELLLAGVSGEGRGSGSDLVGFNRVSEDYHLENHATNGNNGLGVLGGAGGASRREERDTGFGNTGMGRRSSLSGPLRVLGASHGTNSEELVMKNEGGVVGYSNDNDGIATVRRR